MQYFHTGRRAAILAATLAAFSLPALALTPTYPDEPAPGGRKLILSYVMPGNKYYIEVFARFFLKDAQKFPAADIVVRRSDDNAYIDASSIVSITDGSCKKPSEVNELDRMGGTLLVQQKDKAGKIQSTSVSWKPARPSQTSRGVVAYDTESVEAMIAAEVCQSVNPAYLTQIDTAYNEARAAAIAEAHRKIEDTETKEAVAEVKRPQRTEANSELKKLREACKARLTDIESDQATLSRQNDELESRARDLANTLSSLDLRTQLINTAQQINPGNSVTNSQREQLLADGNAYNRREERYRRDKADFRERARRVNARVDSYNEDCAGK